LETTEVKQQGTHERTTLRELVISDVLQYDLVLPAQLPYGCLDTAPQVPPCLFYRLQVLV
jgi:hypothetical protein